MKAAFSKIFAWFKNHLPTKRRLIQVYAALLFNANLKGYVSGRIYTGNTKYACVPGMNCYSCPGAVGGCPLGSLQNALAASGNTAPYYVIGIIALFGLILGRTICGYLCPVGLGQELLYKLKTPKLKKSKFTRVLSYLKYVLLIGFVIIIPILYGQQGIAVPAFCKYVCPAGTFGGGLGLLLNPNNQDYLAMLGPIFTWKFCLLMAIMAACVFIYRAFCRFLCPLGAIYGFFNRFAFIGVHIDSDNCTDCGLCVSHCKMDIKRVGDHECINCGECVDVCPTKAISWKGGKLFLRRNEVKGATESPVPTLETPQTEQNTQPLEDAAPAKLGVTIDGYAGLNAYPVNRALLQSAGISAPMLLPDLGITTGGSDGEPTKNEVDSQQNDASNPDLSVLEATLPEESATQEAHGDSEAQASPSASGSSQRTATAKLKAAVRKPKFWVQCVAIVLALALLVGVFVYYNALQKDVIALAYENELFVGTYETNGDNITVNISADDSAEVSYISLSPAQGGLRLELALNYQATHGNHGTNNDVAVSYVADLKKINSSPSIDGMYSGTIQLVDESGEVESKAQLNGVKIYKDESVRVILSNGNISLQLGNEGQIKTGMLIPQFALNMYQKGEDGKFAYSQDIFDMYEHIGEITVINFWGTWCGPCVAELPSFEAMKQKYPEVTILAIHGDPIDAPKDVDEHEFVSDFITSKGWGAISFAQDVIESRKCITYELLGGKSAWPMTLIVDAYGRISFIRQGSLKEEELEREILALL